MMNLSLRHMLLLLALLIPPVFAQDAEELAAQEQSAQEPSAELPSAQEPSAEEQAAAEQAAAEAMVDEARARVQQVLRDSASRLEAELVQRSSETGPYDVSLSELQSDLGRIYLELGEHEQAVRVLDQALQLLRINRGLYDADQIPVLQNLIASYRGQSDWDNVDSYQHLLFSLQMRAYAPDSPEFADAVLAMGNWQLTSLRSNIGGRPGAFSAVQRLSEVKDLYTSAGLHAEARGDVARQWELMYSAALVDIEIARQYLTTGMDDMIVSAPRYLNQTVCRTVSDGAGGAQRVCWQESVSNPDYYRQVNNERRNLLERARVTLRRSQQDMQTLMDNHPDFVRDNAERTTAGIDNLNRVLEDLRRESRRTGFGGAW